MSSQIMADDELQALLDEQARRVKSASSPDTQSSQRPADMSPYDYYKNLTRPIGRAARSTLTGLTQIVETPETIARMAYNVVNPDHAPYAHKMPSETVQGLIDQYTNNDYAPRSEAEQNVDTASQVAAGGVGAKSVLDLASAAGAGAGAVASRYPDNPFVKALLPILGGLAPAGAVAAKQGIANSLGKIYDIQPDLVQAQEDAGIRPTIQGSSASEAKQLALDRLASTVGGRPLRKAAEQSGNQALREVQDLGYSPDAQPTPVGRVATKGLQGIVKQQLNKGSSLDAQAQALLPEETTMPIEPAKAELADITKDITLPTLRKYATGQGSHKLLEGVINDVTKQPELDAVNSRIAEIESQISQKGFNPSPAELESILNELDPLKARQQQLLQQAQNPVIKPGDLAFMNTALGEKTRVVNPNDPNFSGQVASRAFGAGRNLESAVYKEAGPEASALYEAGNKIYSSGANLRKMVGDVIGEPQKFVTDINAKPADVTQKTVYNDPAVVFDRMHSRLESKPTEYNLLTENMSPEQQATLRAGHLWKFGGGSDWKAQTLAKNILKQEDATINSLTHGNVGMADDLKTVAKAIDLNKNTVGFAGNPEHITPLDYGIFNIIMRPTLALGRTAMNMAFSRMLADPKAIKQMAGMVRVNNGDFPIAKASLMSSLQQSAKQYGKEAAASIQPSNSSDSSSGGELQLLLQEQQRRQGTRRSPESNNSGFQKAVNLVLDHEGGYVPVDGASGAPTNYGINQKAHPEVDVASLTPDKAIEIYKKDYWDKYGVGTLPEAVQDVVLDGVVNHSNVFAKKLVNAARNGASRDELIAMRKREYSRLAMVNPAKYGKSLNGWNNRLNQVQEGR